MVAERNPKQQIGAPLSMIHTPRKRHFQQAPRGWFMANNAEFAPGRNTFKSDAKGSFETENGG
jgi:hypothetical protein